jgi:cell division protein FtsB
VDPSLIGAALAVGLSAIAAWFGWKGKKTDVRERDDANLRDDQREFIAVLRAENKEFRQRVAALENTIDDLRQEITRLQRLLEGERRDREAAQARLAAELSARDRLSVIRSADRAAGAGEVAHALDADDTAAELAISEAGDKAEKQSRDSNQKGDQQ